MNASPRCPTAWIVTVGEPIPGDPTYGRQWRSALLAQALMKEGWKVVFWTSAFDHANKCMRRAPPSQTPEIQYRLLTSRAYDRNVSVARILAHRDMARAFGNEAQAMPRPDIIVCSFPPHELAAACAEEACRQEVPLLLDLRDLWPDAILALLKGRRRIMQPGARLYFRHVPSIMQRADGLVGASDAYLDWGLRMAKRGRGGADGVFPLSYVAPEVKPDEQAEAEARLRRYGVNPSECIAWFIGMFGHSYDLGTVIDAARMTPGMQFVLCGDGDLGAQWRRQAEAVPNVIMPGRIGPAEIAVLGKWANIGLAAYARQAQQDLPNKYFEYLHCKSALVTSLDGVATRELVNKGCALQYRPGDADSLARVLHTLMANPGVLRTIQKQGHAEFQSQYSAEAVYASFARHVSDMASGRTDAPRLASSP